MPRLNLRTAGVYASLLAFSGGSLAVLGLAPFSLFFLGPIAAAAFVLALGRTSPRAGLWRGWLFGVGLLGFGVFWIRISLNEFGNMDAWVAHLLTALFIGGMALYYGLVGWVVRTLDRSRSSWIALVLIFPAAYVLFEWLRGWLLTGFPWLNLGYTQIDSPLAGYAPLLGVYGVSLAVALSGGLLAGLLRWRGAGRVLAISALGVLWGSGAALQSVSWTRASAPPFKATVLQANIPQAIKWSPDARDQILEAYLELTKASLGSELIVWPETAIPSYLHQVKEPLLDPLGQRAREEGAEIVIGIPFVDLTERRFYNGLVSIGSREDIYAKRHLVPFGEFMPFKDWLGPIVKLFEVPMSDFSRGDSERPLLNVGARRAGVSICYEDAFPAEVAEAMPDAEYLINVSNDAWFGDSLAPHQHLEIARMRALENGRFLVRATNTGVSAIIDERGRIQGAIPAFVRDSLTVEIEPRQGSTPYSMVGNWAAIGIAALMLSIGGWLGRRRVRAEP